MKEEAVSRLRYRTPQFVLGIIALASASGALRPVVAQPSREIADLQVRVGLLDQRVKLMEPVPGQLQATIKTFGEVLAKHDQRIQTLEQRVQTLDQRLQSLSKEIAKNGKNDVADKDPKPLTVRAPFAVVDNGGRTILRVDNDTEGPTLTVSSNASRAEITATHLDIRGSGELGGGVALGRGKSGNGFYLLVDKSGADAATLGYQQGESRLAFKMYANQKPVVDLGDNERDPGSGSLRLGNGRGDFVAELGANQRKEMSLRIRGSSNQVVAGLGVNPGGDGGGALKISDRNGAIVASVETKSGTGHVNVFASDGTARANMGAESDGRGFVRIGTSQNVEAASLTIDPASGGGVLQTKNNTGIGATVGTKMGRGGQMLGDLCVNSSKQKGTCFSTLAAKALIIYF